MIVAPVGHETVRGVVLVTSATLPAVADMLITKVEPTAITLYENARSHSS